ncbi:thiosulfate oxidation carrier complex protein SoxZ [Thiobacillus denitrificans]|jgi:sulfur-oxidizing protein SoxZ|uniref:thiosulfate oxidation carrier complex protein SoxZ n=1 Tax=Thiobacillus denitrificans TaxID=36861 RepID=UPI00037EBBD2|nr:thiosulfate oxidation carrier complex protein SoxZ [Thiobacillus denitrificans]
MAEPMKIRTQLSGDLVAIKVLIGHVMETGQRKDPRTGQVIPAHFIKQLSVGLNGKTVIAAQWGGAISKDPFLGLKVKGAKAGDKITVHWEDSKGEKNSAEATVG